MARLDRLSLAQRLGDSALLPVAHGVLGNTLNYRSSENELEIQDWLP